MTRPRSAPSIPTASPCKFAFRLSDRVRGKSLGDCRCNNVLGAHVARDRLSSTASYHLSGEPILRRRICGHFRRELCAVFLASRTGYALIRWYALRPLPDLEPSAFGDLVREKPLVYACRCCVLRLHNLYRPIVLGRSHQSVPPLLSETSVDSLPNVSFGRNIAAPDLPKGQEFARRQISPRTIIFIASRRYLVDQKQFHTNGKFGPRALFARISIQYEVAV